MKGTSTADNINEYTTIFYCSKEDEAKVKAIYSVKDYSGYKIIALDRTNKDEYISDEADAYHKKLIAEGTITKDTKIQNVQALKYKPANDFEQKNGKKVYIPHDLIADDFSPVPIPLKQ